METGIIMFLIGLFIGLIAGVLRLSSLSIGTLRIVKSDEDQPYLFLELDKSVNTLNSKKYAFMEVRHESYISHE